MTDKGLSKLVTVIDSKLDKFEKEINKEIADGKKAFKEEIVASENRVI